jgi:hypothetical protein
LFAGPEKIIFIQPRHQHSQTICQHCIFTLQKTHKGMGPVFINVGYIVLTVDIFPGLFRKRLSFGLPHPEMFGLLMFFFLTW